MLRNACLYRCHLFRNALCGKDVAQRPALGYLTGRHFIFCYILAYQLIQYPADSHSHLSLVNVITKVSLIALI